uniref:4-hydroxyphenylpyruvate dioxygenase n=1 Tax=Meloidogyne javanica TaxID=6303 RepID=A0A915LXR3_MELJA
MNNQPINLVEHFHHIKFYVSNAFQASFWYCFHFGFERFAKRQSEKSSEIAIRNGKIILVFKSVICPKDPESIGAEVAIHGDFVKDICLSNNNYQILQPKTFCNDSNGSLWIARIAGSGGSIVHTLIQNIDYNGPFLPGFKFLQNFDFCSKLSPIKFDGIDHVVEAHPEDFLDKVVSWYEEILKMRRFWSIDDKIVKSEFSALRAILIKNGNVEEEEENKNLVQIALVSPVNVNGIKRRGQVKEFLDFHGQPGIQHIAFQTNNIIKQVEELQKRGLEFLKIPSCYYDLLEERLNKNLKIKEDLNKLRELGILMDFDENATLFFEIIQRNNFNGFGAGNFKALFAAVEMEQKEREANLAKFQGK